ncbi:NitT/TauT family transport system permease protein [Azospirillum agricola]|uniref:ABC transporter permease n=1 Tax=Azospirillum agricola TaxID=1720247 RepID=UPI001F24A52A|nr:ABC transporter permease [Azospirillum agricola]MBP2231915.1 NitT/TauT family transport system permease protein [Azospirillum agricola]
MPFRGRGFAPAATAPPAILAFATLITVWQAVGTAEWVNPLFLPSPAAIARALWTLAASGELWTHLTRSALRVGGGWIAGTAGGLVVGCAVGLFSLTRSVGLSLVSAFYPIPKIALLPLLILWLGIGETPKVATIALGVFFPTVIAVCGGVDQVPRNLIRMAQSFDVPFSTILRRVILPSALPAILSGFRISSSTALLLVVSSEMIGADSGIGAFITQAGNLMKTADLLAGVVVLSILGLVVARTISWLERRALRWRA